MIRWIKKRALETLAHYLYLEIAVEHAVAVQIVKGQEQLREPAADPLA
jgi:hypothetical protein